MLILLLSAVFGFAAKNEGKAKGELHVSGEAVKLQHAYAIEKNGKLTVILSDRPVPEATIGNYETMVALAEIGEVRAIQVVIRSKIAEEVFFFDDRLPSKLSVKEPGPFTSEKMK